MCLWVHRCVSVPKVSPVVSNSGCVEPQPRTPGPEAGMEETQGPVLQRPSRAWEPQADHGRDNRSPHSKKSNTNLRLFLTINIIMPFSNADHFSCTIHCIRRIIEAVKSRTWTKFQAGWKIVYLYNFYTIFRRTQLLHYLILTLYMYICFYFKFFSVQSKTNT